MEVTMMQCVSFAGCRFTGSGRDTAGLAHILLQKTHEEKTHHSAVRRGASGGRMYLPHSLPSPVSHCHFTRVQKWRDSWARRRHRLRDRGGGRGNLGRCTKFVSSTLHTLRYSGPRMPSLVSALPLQWGDHHPPREQRHVDPFPGRGRGKSSQRQVTPSWWPAGVAWKTEARRL